MAALGYAFVASEVYKAYQEKSVPAPAPKQSHYVVFLEVCGVLEGILLTTNPPVFVGEDNLADADILELIREAIIAKRYMAVKHWRGYCPETEKL